jgi:hypothetical protein
MKKFLLCLLITIPCLAFAQTAERIEKLLEQNRVSYRDAALMVLEASGSESVPDTIKRLAAQDIARERGKSIER